MIASAKLAGQHRGVTALIALACICLLVWQMERGDLDRKNVFRKMSFGQALTTGSLVGMTRKETALLLPEIQSFFDNGSAGEIHVLWQEPARCWWHAYDMTEGVVFEYDSNERVRGWHVSQHDWHYHRMCNGFRTGLPSFRTLRRVAGEVLWSALCYELDRQASRFPPERRQKQN